MLLHLLLQTIISLSLSFVVPRPPFNDSNDNKCYTTNNAAENHGFLNIYLMNYWLGGMSDCRDSSDQSKKMVYNSNKNAYCLDYVLYEGDSFYLTVLTFGDITFSTDVNEEAVESLNRNFVSRRPTDSYFFVNKTGTYHFEISDSIDDTEHITPNLYYKLINDYSNSFVSYYSESTDMFNPVGTFTFLLHGSFDGAGFTTSVGDDKKFFFNNSNNQYELTIGLFKGDVFCPYSQETNYLFYYSCGEDQFKANNIDHDSRDYFVVKRDGTYKISLSYKVEYYPEAKFGWHKDGGCSILFVSDSLPQVDIKGTEEIVLVGRIKGSYVGISSSSYKLKFDPITKSYNLKIKFKKDDYFCLYLYSKNNYIKYLNGDSYAKNIFDGACLSNYSSGSLDYFYVNVGGYYECSIGGSVENLPIPSHTWKSHGNSYIRYIGNSEKAAYILLGSRSGGINTLYTGDAKSQDIHQYGTTGLFISPINDITFFASQNNDDLSGKIVKINYNPNISSFFDFTNTVNESVAELNKVELLENNAYTLKDKNGSSSLGGACSFLDELYSSFVNYNNDSSKLTFANIDELDAKRIVKKYNSLTDEQQNYVDDSTIRCYGTDGTLDDYKIVVIMKTVISLSKQQKQLKTFIAVLAFLFAISTMAAFFIISLKRMNSNSKNEDIYFLGRHYNHTKFYIIKI